MRVITRLNVGGPAIHAVLLTRELAQLGYRTSLISGVCESADGDMTYLLDASDPVSWVPEMSRSVSPWKNVCALARIWRLIRAERPDIVHTHTAMAGCLGRVAALFAGVPIVVHTFHGNSLRGYFSPVVEKAFLRIERLLAKFTDAICVVSAQQLRELSDGFRIAPISRCRVVPLGMDLSPFLALSPPVLGERLKVGWFGRLVPVKDVPLLVRVIEATFERTESIQFHVAGDGSEGDSIRAAVERFGPRVVWHGWLKDIAPLVERCHVLIQTSRNEGTPVALIQGMAAARPFISTAVGGLVDMVTGAALRNSEGASWYSNGVLVDPDPVAFAVALMELLGRPERLLEMGQKARLFASVTYRKEALVSALDSLYRELLQAKSLGNTIHGRDGTIGH